MFFPDKVDANREAWRVLSSGGRYLLVTFDRVEHNPVPKAAQDAVAELFPDDPPDYMERGPFSYTDPAVIEQDLLAAGFADVQVETVAASSRVSPPTPPRAWCSARRSARRSSGATPPGSTGCSTRSPRLFARGTARTPRSRRTSSPLRKP